MNKQEYLQLERLAQYLEGESNNFLRHSVKAMEDYRKELIEVKIKLSKGEINHEPPNE